MFELPEKDMGSTTAMISVFLSDYNPTIVLFNNCSSIFTVLFTGEERDFRSVRRFH